MSGMQTKISFLYQFVDYLIWNIMEINLQCNETAESVSSIINKWKVR